jgi:transcriptional regulator
MEKSSLDVVRGTLDVLILKTVSWGAMHGYAISQNILRQTDEALLVEEGALYPALYRMEAKGWIEGEWGLSENNRRAKYYRLTPDGRRRLRLEMETWRHYAEAVGKVLGATTKPQWEKT